MMKKLVGFLTLMLLIPALPLSLAAENSPSNLDDKIQNLKKEVMKLNRDLFILEEELLFPTSTQIAVFLSTDVGNYFRLDSVQLKIDDKVVANYLYTNQERDALSRGGVQRLYIGNVKKGKREIVAVFNGPGPNGRDYKRATTHVFEKGSGTKYIELKITDVSQKLQPEFIVKEWE
ncbi:MAG TPA: AraC family transcriptional regulator [Gammaproteobacteria bacterium]